MEGLIADFGQIFLGTLLPNFYFWRKKIDWTLGYACSQF